MSQWFGVLFLLLLGIYVVIFKNYGFALTRSLIVSIFIVAATLLFYTSFVRKKLNLRKILIFCAGFFLGLFLARGVTLSLYPVFVNFPYLQEILFITLPYLFGFGLVEVLKDGSLQDIFKGRGELYCTRKVLDTSAIIDGRIIEMIKLGFVEGEVIIPRFVLEELQYLSDSPDSTIRVKGKKGLSLVSEVKGLEKPEVVIYEKDFPRIKDVDSKLLELCKLTGAKLITTDYNLNKVATIKGIEVLNVNELANALKPVVAVGEELIVFLSREGKEKEQGVGYLDDGTMIVVDGGRPYVGHRVRVSVNNILQTSSGKIIFGKPVEVVK